MTLTSISNAVHSAISAHLNAGLTPRHAAACQRVMDRIYDTADRKLTETPSLLASLRKDVSSMLLSARIEVIDGNLTLISDKHDTLVKLRRGTYWFDGDENIDELIINELVGS